MSKHERKNLQPSDLSGEHFESFENGLKKNKCANVWRFLGIFSAGGVVGAGVGAGVGTGLYFVTSASTAAAATSSTALSVAGLSPLVSSLLIGAAIGLVAGLALTFLITVLVKRSQEAKHAKRIKSFKSRFKSPTAVEHRQAEENAQNEAAEREVVNIIELKQDGSGAATGNSSSRKSAGGNGRGFALRGPISLGFTDEEIRVYGL